MIRVKHGCGCDRAPLLASPRLSLLLLAVSGLATSCTSPPRLFPLLCGYSFVSSPLLVPPVVSCHFLTSPVVWSSLPAPANNSYFSISTFGCREKRILRRLIAKILQRLVKNTRFTYGRYAGPFDPDINIEFVERLVTRIIGKVKRCRILAIQSILAISHPTTSILI